MDTLGRHLLVEYWGCVRDVLDDRFLLEASLQRAAIASNATIVSVVFHQFNPHGVSGVVVVEESHLSIHTWPEQGYAAVDFYTCGEADPMNAHAVLLDVLGATHCEVMCVERGRKGGIEIQSHTNSTSQVLDLAPKGPAIEGGAR